jgi:predicted enzyme related to lactoylglutathione lyase
MAKKKKKGPPKKSRPSRKTSARKARRAAPRSARRPRAQREAAAPPPMARGGVVHWELQAQDEQKQRAFYSELFGWRIDANNPQHYGVVAAAGPGSIGGGFSQAGPGEPARVTFYVGVPSIEETLAKVVALGGQPTMARTDLGMVVMAQFRDLEGNLIGLVEG